MISNRFDTSYNIHEQSFTQEVQCGHYSIKTEREKEREVEKKERKRQRAFPRIEKDTIIPRYQTWKYLVVIYS